MPIQKKFYYLTITLIPTFIGLFIFFNSSKITSVPDNAIRIISFGDNPHVSEGQVENYLDMLLDSINQYNSSLVIHVGDTLGGREPCTDSMIDLQQAILNRLNSPVLYTPGDNEWRDCYQEKKINVYDNQERLDYIRKTYFSKNKTLGINKLFVENNGNKGYPENARIIIKNVAFITAHLVGSNNNYDPINERNTLEYYARDEANINWIKESFNKYQDSSAFVVAIHADMYTEESSLSPEYKEFGMTLYKMSNKYKKPVLLLYGDSHEYKNFQPMPNTYPYMYAIENYGNPDIKALLIEIDNTKNKPFKVIKVIKGESFMTWLFRNFQRVINFLKRNIKTFLTYFN